MLTEHGVSIAPRTFYAWATRAPSKRALWDATITEILAGYYEPDALGHRRPESLYGSLKMWAHLQREGIPVAKSTVHGGGPATTTLADTPVLRAESAKPPLEGLRAPP